MLQSNVISRGNLSTICGPMKAIPETMIMLVALTSCGGGGGSDTPDFSGQYAAHMTTFRDTCNNPPDLGSWDVTYTVQQNGSQVLVADDSGIELPGVIDTATDPSGFTALNDGNVGCSGGGTQHSQVFVTFSNVTNTSANIEFDRGTGQCSTHAGLDCEYRAHGTARRQ